MIAATMAVTTAPVQDAARAKFARDARLFRFLALLVDLFLLGLITFVVNSVYGVTQPTQGLTIGGGSYSTAVAWPWLTLVGVLYFAIPEAMFGATPGKAWARLRVVRIDCGALGIGSVLARNVLRVIDFLPVLYLLGGVLVLAMPGSQRLGDLGAGTTVVYRHRATEPGATRTSGARARHILVSCLVFATLVTAAFDYFGRPPLVIAGDFNAQTADMRGVQEYTLGQATWSPGQVTYPITLTVLEDTTPAQLARCSGSITLVWGWLGGWTFGQSGWSCNPT